MALKVVSGIFTSEHLFVIFDQYLLKVGGDTPFSLGKKGTNDVEAKVPSLGLTQALVGEYQLSHTVFKEISVSLISQITRFTREDVVNFYI